MLQQHSLFPDGHEAQAAALAALREMDLFRARRWVARARTLERGLANLAALEQAVRWLEERLSSRPSAEDLAAALVAVAADGLAGRLGAVAASFVDDAIARFLLRQGGVPTAFVDAGERVPRSLLPLILGDAAAARAPLEAVVHDGRQRRGDLWGWLGDANWKLQHPEAANACYVRALLGSAADVDLWRLRDQRLGAVYAALRGAHDEACARELLLAAAWCEGVLAIPPRNGWLGPAASAALSDAALLDPAMAGEAARCRRFSLLLYLDRSAAPGGVDLERRTQMAELHPELFARYIRRCEQLELQGRVRRR